MRTRKVTAVLLALGLLLSACASGPDDTAGEGSRLGNGDKKSRKKDDAEGKVSKKEKKELADELEEAEDEAGQSGGLASGGAAPPSGSGGGSGLAKEFENFESDKGAEYAQASAVVEEPGNDAETGGLPSNYSELRVARIEGLGKDLRMTLEMSGDVPEKMPNGDTYMVVAFSMAMNEDERYAFSLQATDEGWRAFAGGKKNSDKFPGTFDISGPVIEMVIPWAYIGGPRTFKWLANSSWFQSVASTTHYSFDPAPNRTLANFPN